MEEIQNKKEHMDAVTKALLEQKPTDYEELIQLLHQFMVGTLEYYLLLFVDSAFEGEMEMLPPEAQAAVHLNNMFFRAEGDWTGMLSDMKLAAQCFPQLGEHAQSLAQHIKVQVEEQKRMSNTVSQNANAELQQMVEAMKSRICQMVEQGMYTEAKATIAQLRAIVPEDEELALLEKNLSE